MTVDLPMQLEQAAITARNVADWKSANRPSPARLVFVIAAHVAVGILLWRSVIAPASTLVVPVSLQMLAPQADSVTPPEPLPPRSPAPMPTSNRTEQQTIQMPDPDVPVISSVSLPVSAPEPPAAPPPAAPTVAPDVVPAVPRIQLPSATADYLSNPAPAYPPMSKRLQEQGRVLLYVLVDARGQPARIELKASSGYSRLDEAALATVQRWTFVPGRRNGVAESMWVEVPIEFRLRV